MGIEIEAKLKLDDLPAMEKKLAALGASFVGECLETNTYFDAPDHRLKSEDQGLRIRVQDWSDGDRTITITHKGPRSHGKLKSRSETEVVVADGQKAASILGQLGYFPVLAFEKRRSRWKLNDCWVELDTLPYLGDYIEIEGPDDDDVLAAREKLGLADVPLVRASYIALLITHLHELGLNDNQVRFDDVRESADIGPANT